MGIGSTGGSMLARDARNPKALLGWSQMLLAGAVAWTAYMLSDSLPYWPINPLLSTSPWFTFQIDMVRCLWALLPADPAVGRELSARPGRRRQREGDPGRLVGGIYAANTGGAILGALVRQHDSDPVDRHRGQPSGIDRDAGRQRPADAGPAVAAVPSRPTRWPSAAAAAVALPRWRAPSTPVPGMLIAYGRRMMTSMGRSEVLYTGEGINSSIAITKWDDGAVQFHVSGKVEASTEPYDMRLQRMLGHLPALVHKDPKSVLIVGFGAGVTAGTFRAASRGSSGS